MPSLKRWSELSAEDKQRVALRVEAIRVVHRAEAAAAALLAGDHQAALNLAGETRMIVRKAIK